MWPWPARCRCPSCPSAGPPTPGHARPGRPRRSGSPSPASRTGLAALVDCDRQTGRQRAGVSGSSTRSRRRVTAWPYRHRPGPRVDAAQERIEIVGQLGRSVRSVSAAIIPQPMSTPTADGMTAPTVGMTEPMVAPMPTWASGMRATWPATNGSLARAAPARSWTPRGPTPGTPPRCRSWSWPSCPLLRERTRVTGRDGRVILITAHRTRSDASARCTVRLGVPCRVSRNTASRDGGIGPRSGPHTRAVGTHRR